MQFKFAFIAAAIFSTTLASPYSLVVRDDQIDDPLVGQDLVVSINGSASFPSFPPSTLPPVRTQERETKAKLTQMPPTAALSPELTQTCVKLDCADLLLHVACVGLAIAAKKPAKVLKCIGGSTYEKVCLLFP
ncbi:hypothetical protein N431DRAFT_455655 [Stipitochalara longipes BDJ]|nr:hypothetical protein N431DRAFT_455655 [Stipitochalara longipes BDJ]